MSPVTCVKSHSWLFLCIQDLVAFPELLPINIENLNFVISPYAWLYVTYIHWEMSTSWPGKTDNWENVLFSYDPIYAKIMVIEAWYFQNWDWYMCGFLMTSTTSDCAITKKYFPNTSSWSSVELSKHLLSATGSRQFSWRSADWIQTPEYKHTV